MLQSIHDKAKGILGIIIVIFLGLVFALWGVGDYLTGATEKFVAKVDDMEISQSEFDQSVAKQRQRLEQMYKDGLPKSPLFEQRMKEQVLEQLITQRVLQKMVNEQGYRVADQVLAQKIKLMEAFQQDGIFAVDVYQSLVQSQGMAVKEFESLFRNDLAVQQLQDAVMRSSMIGPAELNILNQIQNQSRKVNYLLFSDTNYINDVTVSDEEIQTYFDANQSAYMHPESVSVSYVELKPSSLIKDIPVDEEAVRRLYDEYVAGIASKEQRKASHILIETSADADEAIKKAEAEELIARINNGEAFADLAKQYSKDPGSAVKGGDLGWVSRGMMVAEFEKALFALNKGEISTAVKSSFGFHIIKMLDTKVEKITSFADKKSELTQQFQLQAIEDHFYEKSELMATTAYENDQSLQAVADAIDSEIKRSTLFSRNQGSGIAEDAKVRKAAFEDSVLAEGRNSEIIELGKNHVIVLRVDTHNKAKPKSLDEVKDQITQSLKIQQANRQSKQAALAALVKFESGATIESESTYASAKLVKLGSIKRDNQTADPLIVNEAFMMKKPLGNKPVYKVIELATGSAVIELSEVNVPTEASPEQLNILAKQYQNEQATRDMMVVLEHLKSKSKIVRPEEL